MFPTERERERERESLKCKKRTYFVEKKGENRKNMYLLNLQQSPLFANSAIRILTVYDTFGMKCESYGF